MPTKKTTSEANRGQRAARAKSQSTIQTRSDSRNFVGRLDDTPPVSSPDDGVFDLEVHVVDALSNYSVAGRLRWFTPGEVAVRLPESLSEYRWVLVKLSSFVFQGEILYCRPVSREYEAHITILADRESGLRRTPRFPLNLPGRMFMSNTTCIPIRILDISRDGIRLETPVRVDPGKPVAIESEHSLVFATVRFCRKTSEETFRIGVEMQDVIGKAIAEPKKAPHGLLQRLFG